MSAPAMSATMPALQPSRAAHAAHAAEMLAAFQPLEDVRDMLAGTTNSRPCSACGNATRAPYLFLCDDCTDALAAHVEDEMRAELDGEVR